MYAMYTLVWRIDWGSQEVTADFACLGGQTPDRSGSCGVGEDSESGSPRGWEGWRADMGQKGQQNDQWSISLEARAELASSMIRVSSDGSCCEKLMRSDVGSV